MTLTVQAIVSGVLVGGLYALMSLGISLSWGVLKIINLAHFAFILLSAYVTYALATGLGWDPFLAVVVTVPVFFVLGGVLQWAFDRFKVSEFESLLVTFGLLIIFESLTRTVWSADFRRIPVELNPYPADSLWIGPIALQLPQLAAFVTAVAVSIGVIYLLERTFFGKAVRALAEDAEIASAFGVDNRRVAMLLSGIAAGLAAMAGVFIAISSALFPGLAVEWFAIVFPVVILGGLGSARGALAAGVLIGVVAGLASVWFGPTASPLVTFLILIATLLFRPQGLFARRSLA